MEQRQQVHNLENLYATKVDFSLDHKDVVQSAHTDNMEYKSRLSETNNALGRNPEEPEASS